MAALAAPRHFQTFYGKRLLFLRSGNTTWVERYADRRDTEVDITISGDVEMHIDSFSAAKTTAILNIVQAFYLLILLMVGNWFFMRVCAEGEGVGDHTL